MGLIRRYIKLAIRPCMYGVRYASVDITGCAVRMKTVQSMSVLDDSIMRIITLNDKKFDYDAIINAGKQDRDCAMFYIISIYDDLRAIRKISTKDKLVRSFDSLLKLNAAKMLSAREVYLMTALYCWYHGDYFRASLLLESNNTSLPHDTLSMKLAHDCHIASGNNYGSLSCITRYMPMINQSHPIRRNLLGLLSHGFVESKLVLDAEETSLRAIEMTSEHDLCSISANLNMFLVGCKAAEASAAVDRYKEKHYKTPLGPVFFSYYLGYAHSLRGNNSAAIREVGLCIDAMEASWLQQQPLHLTYLANCTFLLWYISLNLKANNAVVHILWNRLASLWHTCVPQHINKTPFEELCCMISYSIGALTEEGGIPASDCLPLQLMEYENLNTSHAAVYDNKEYKPVESRESLQRDGTNISSFGSSIWNLFGSTTKATDVAATVKEEVNATVDTLPLLTKDELKDILDKQCAFHESILNDTVKNERIPGMESVLANIPFVLQFKRFGVHTNATSTSSEKHVMMRQFTIPFCQAVQLMCRGKYSEAANILLELQSISASHLGSTVLHHAIVETTLVEALLRSGMWSEATSSLLHRTTIYPNDGQSWRRLAIAMHQQGNMELANVARYTAYELGIGQGGYGGSKA